MFDEWGKEDDQWRPDEPKAWKITKKAIGIAFSTFVFVFIGFLVLRVILSDPPSKMEKPVWDDRLFASYTEAQGNGTGLEMLQIPTSDAFSEDGMFSLYTVTYTPAAKQLQFTVRYNNRVLNYLLQDYPDAQSVIDADGEVYVFSLTVRKDGKEETLTAYSYVGQERFGYTFRRIIFNDIDLEGVSIVTVNAAYVGKPSAIRHTMTAYNYAVHKTVYDLPIFSYSKPQGVTDGIKNGADS